MSMSLSQFRKHLFESFSLMRDTRASFEVHHRRKVYLINVEATGRKVTTPYKSKGRSNRIPIGLVESAPCPECKSLLVSGLCMNKKCPSNQKAPVLGG